MLQATLLTDEQVKTYQRVLKDCIEMDDADGLGLSSAYPCNPRNVAGKLCWLQRMLFTVAVMIDCDDDKAKGGRLCFDDMYSAAGFLNHWTGAEKEVPKVGEDGLKADKRNV